MLYYLFEWLHKLNFPGAGMFGYTSFRALMAIILALLISSIWGDKFINLLKRKQITETQRDAKIDPFGVNKVGVPSMGCHHYRSNPDPPVCYWENCIISI